MPPKRSTRAPYVCDNEGWMPRLRIVSVNDVYSLENLPRLKSLVDHYASQVDSDALLVVLAGDFLAPSLLSSIDAGRGMVDCLNRVGVTHVVLGNHEDDIPAEELRHRLAELAPKCLGTNVRSGLELPRHDVIDVGGLKIGLVGVVMADESVYRGKPFGGATLVDANRAAIEEASSLIASGCTDVIAITHQSIADDRALAMRLRPRRFPAIIGGHEHTPMLVDVEGTWIVKAGSEAVQAVVTEIVWSTPDGAGPAVTTRLEEVSRYPEDPAVRAIVDAHMATVRELASATLYHAKPGELLSSRGTRSKQTTLGTLICSRLRDCLDAEAGLFNGGGIRAAHDYPERFTYGDLEAEVPFDNEVVVVPIPGRVIREAVAVSRSKAPLESGAFLQVDDLIIVEEPGGVVVGIDGAPLDPDRDYQVATVRELLLGLDHVGPLVQWAKENPALVPPLGSGREPKIILLQSFALGIWRELGGFEAVDLDGDDRVTPEEIAAAVAQKHPSQPPSTVLADIVMRAVDVDADQVITRADEAALAQPRRPPPKE